MKVAGDIREVLEPTWRTSLRFLITDGEEGPSKPMKTVRERAEEKRQEKLTQVRDQVENGGLIIRQMTDEERRRYPPREPRPKQQGKK